MTGRSTRYPYGSTTKLRADVLAVLGVLKVATAEQIMTLTRPELAAAGRREPTKAHRNAALDLARHKETLSEGSTPSGRKLWGLTRLGLESAARVLDRPLEEMGSIARGVGRNGAQHAMAVNDTVTAFLQPASSHRGLGTLDAWATEIALPATGSWSRPGAGSARADAVVTAPEAGVPVLFVEVDRGHMTPARIAGKLVKYQRFFCRRIKDSDGRQRALWRTRWHAPPLDEEDPHPPVVLVFTGAGPRGLAQRIEAVRELSRPSWAPQHTEVTMWDEGYFNYRGRIPVLATTLDRLAEHGPWGPAFYRYGHTAWEPLDQALKDPDDRNAYLHRQELASERARQAKAEREARRPRCAQCSQRFSDSRWRQVEDKNGQRDAWTSLCSSCAQTAAECARRRQEAARAAAEEAAITPPPEAAPAPRGFLARFRR